MVEALAILAKHYAWDPRQVIVDRASRGFSGADVWKVTYEAQAYALKRFPPGHPAYLSLSQIHGLMAQARGVGARFVPQLVPTVAGGSNVDGQWELVSWQPGQPQDTPDIPCMRAAVLALAQLRTIWRTASSSRQPCLAVELRHRRLSEWSEADAAQLESSITRDSLGQRAYHGFRSNRERAIRQLQPWLNRKVTVQPCLGDVWAEHVLFTDNAVTGIIDYGGMRNDHPSQDVARLLGSYRLPRPVIAEAVASYPAATDDWCDLTLLLIETGRVAAVSNWLRWLYLERRPFPDRDLALSRLARLVEQLEGSPAGRAEAG